jgi:hypothetical protein
MELESLMEETVVKLQDDFYSKKFYFSYSSLNKLMWNPAVFYQMYVLGNKEERTDAHLVQGKIIHALLLEEEKFNDQFVISPGKLPGDNIKIIVDRVYSHHVQIAKDGDTRTNLEEFDGAILDIMRDINYFQNLKTDIQRVEKVITLEATNYWAFLKIKGAKTLIDQETYDYCKSAVELIKTNKSICDLIGCNLNDFSNVEVFNEIPVQVDLVNKNFGVKGIIDNLVLDHDKKIIFVNDIKTTSKDLKDFPESVEFYSYWMQATIYLTMVSTIYKDLIDKGYQIKFHFVVIDRVFQTYAFPISSTTYSDWLERLFGVLDKAEWHYDNKSYELPYDFATGSVTL